MASQMQAKIATQIAALQAQHKEQADLFAAQQATAQEKNVAALAALMKSLSAIEEASSAQEAKEAEIKQLKAKQVELTLQLGTITRKLLDLEGAAPAAGYYAHAPAPTSVEAPIQRQVPAPTSVEAPTAAQIAKRVADKPVAKTVQVNSIAQFIKLRNDLVCALASKLNDEGITVSKNPRGDLKIMYGGMLIFRLPGTDGLNEEMQLLASNVGEISLTVPFIGYLLDILQKSDEFDSFTNAHPDMLNLIMPMAYGFENRLQQQEIPDWLKKYDIFAICEIAKKIIDC